MGLSGAPSRAPRAIANERCRFRRLMRIRKSKENLPGPQISQPTYKGSLTERFPNLTAAPNVPMTSLAMHFEGERHLEGWMTETGSDELSGGEPGPVFYSAENIRLGGCGPKSLGTKPRRHQGEVGFASTPHCQWLIAKNVQFIMIWLPSLSKYRFVYST